MAASTDRQVARASAEVPRLAAAGYNFRRLLAWLARLALLLSALLAALAIEQDEENQSSLA